MTDTDSYEKTFRWELDFSLNLGETDRKFFEGLKEKRILGKECPDCGRVFVPPQPYCDECFARTDEWVEMEQEAVVESYTVTFRQFRNMPEPPYINGAIKIGDSATSLLHFIGGIDYDEPEDLIDEVSSGTVVEPVWDDDRDGDILDIKHFEPVN
ncbi:Zn-ribbon domain-containing OB-fold protein [Natronomonas amylolytica]|uniref:Zn-ribbon domain-containing OB-fold protein n=1 Tax=Natronomonas amylolytica TaxID=3108498 RepID=UPI00300B1B05